MYKKIAPATYEIPQEGAMRVPGLVIATAELMKGEELEKPLEQVRNVACLPGIVGYSIAMPDIHWGYGFPIGGVAAMDVETGVISPGGVGYDINCGVRLALAPIPYKDLSHDKKDKLLYRIFSLVPSGVGHGRKNQKLSDEDYENLIRKGAKWSIEQGYGFAEDLDHIESKGVLEEADLSAVSYVARQRGRPQLGTIGSGNHFVEIGAVGQIFDPKIAHAWGVEEGMTYILIHSGSRGFGHQVCQDTLDTFLQKGFARNLPDLQLACAPIKSPEGEHYFRAMAAAANFAFNNRQQILHAVREAFHDTLKIAPNTIRLLYDVCHNIAKFETHPVNGKPQKLCVHRKGATRAYGPGAEELSPLFRPTGQPVIVPGDMGRASHLMVGKGNPLTWCSACHGAGRALSRIKSKKAWAGKNIYDYMTSKGVKVLAASDATVAEEMPDAYKDVDEVVLAVEEAALADRVARLTPGLVIKG
ncbi:MAG: RtcB family protein [Rhabdochlamydiaceae bacterium]|nr:RtcB family protein [Rhabdochlamydiaceae bacterium]